MLISSDLWLAYLISLLISHTSPIHTQLSFTPFSPRSFICMMINPVTLHITPHYLHLPPNITSLHSTRHHWSICNELNTWSHSPHHIRPNNPAFLLYTHGLVTVLPPNNYTRNTMNIIDHMYIGILLPLFHTVVIEKLTKTYPILTYPIPYSLLKYSSRQSTP